MKRRNTPGGAIFGVGAFLLVLFWCTTILAAEKVRLTVTVTLAEEEKVVAGAEVSFNSVSLHGTTDERGLVSFIIDPGVYILNVHAEGLQKQNSRIVVKPGSKQSVLITLNPIQVVEEEIVVVPVEEKIGNRYVSRETVISLPGAAEDPFKAMQATPGIIGISEADSRLYVRGSPPSENLILLDGVPIYDPYRLFGLVTLFDPETVSYFTIWPGGFPARYGNRLSAVIEVNNRYGTTERSFSGSLNASFTNSSILAEGKLALDKGAGSWMLTARRTYYDVMLNALNTGPSRFPYFFDIQGRLYYQPSEGHDLSFFSIYSKEGTDLNEEFDDEFEPVDVQFIDDQEARIGGFTYDWNITPRIRSAMTLSYYNNSQVSDARVFSGEEQFFFKFALDLQTTEYMVQEHFEFMAGEDHVFETGLHYALNKATSFISLQSDDPSITIPDSLKNYRADSENEKFGIYFHDQWELTQFLETGLGLRFDQDSLTGFERWSPRARLTLKLSGANRINLSYGQYYHYPSYETLQGEGLLYDLENIDDYNLKPEQATHYCLGFEHEKPGNIKFSLEMYRKDLTDLLTGKTEYLDVLLLNEDGSTEYRSIENKGIEPYNGDRGFAHGLEFLIQKESLLDDKLTLQFSYSLAETKIKRENEEWRYRRYDQRHTANITGEYRFSDRWYCNFIWRFGSGFPYSPPGEIVYVVEDINGNGLYDPKDGERISALEIKEPSLENSKRYPFYHRLDGRINFEMKRPSYTAIFYLDIINLYAQENVISYEYNDDYSERKEETGFPFLPTFGVHLKY